MLIESLQLLAAHQVCDCLRLVFAILHHCRRHRRCGVAFCFFQCYYFHILLQHADSGSRSCCVIEFLVLILADGSWRLYVTRTLHPNQA